jgi:hypothetical protein
LGQQNYENALQKLNTAEGIDYCLTQFNT